MRDSMRGTLQAYIFRVLLRQLVAFREDIVCDRLYGSTFVTR